MTIWKRGVTDYNKFITILTFFLEFYNICEKSTDFHFADLAEQLEAIKLLVDKNQDEAKSKKSVEKLQVGEIYITKHSNLSQVHVVFHVVIDGSLLGDISSRHPVILAYRNVIKTAFKNDVKTLTIPLLLVHEMTEVRRYLSIFQKNIRMTFFRRK